MEDLDQLPSPVPSTSLRDRDEFCGLDLHKQLGYTKGVLQAILNNSYPPVQSRHERFMRGGKERAALDKDASLKGVMTSREVSKLTKLLIRWVLRDLVKANQVAEDFEVCTVSLGIGLITYTHVKVATELYVAADADFSLEPPPSSFAGSVYLGRDSEVHQPVCLPLSMPTEESQEPEELSPHTASTAHSLPLTGCPAYENLTVREKLDVSL